jgi:hypothetical protein
MQIPKKYIIQEGGNRGKLNQAPLQTGNDKGTYTKGDKHPFIKGFFYSRWWHANNTERWLDKNSFERLKLIERKAKNKYKKTDKGKTTEAKYLATEKSDLRIKRYTCSDKGRKRKRENQKKFYKTDKGKVNSLKRGAKRRARKKKASTKLTFAEEQLIRQYYNHSVRLKNKLGIDFHVDHIVPLSLGGLHHPSNLQVVPAVWNMRKHNNNTDQWLPNGL